MVVWTKNSDDILSKGIYLGSDGIKNWALDKDQIVVALKSLEEQRTAVLGGDLCIVASNGKILPTGETWFCEKREGESREDFVRRSVFEAMEFVAWSATKNERVYFTVVPD
jgi:hypothetical protein